MGKIKVNYYDTSEKLTWVGNKLFTAEEVEDIQEA